MQKHLVSGFSGQRIQFSLYIRSLGFCPTKTQLADTTSISVEYCCVEDKYYCVFFTETKVEMALVVTPPTASKSFSGWKGSTSVPRL